MKLQLTQNLLWFFPLLSHLLTEWKSKPTDKIEGELKKKNNPAPFNCELQGSEFSKAVVFQHNFMGFETYKWQQHLNLKMCHENESGEFDMQFWLQKVCYMAEPSSSNGFAFSSHNQSRDWGTKMCWCSLEQKVERSVSVPVKLYICKQAQHFMP